MVRDVDIYAGNPVGSQWYFEGNLGQTIATAHMDAPTIGVSYMWRGRQVFYAGESFLVRADSPVDVTVSGYLLVEP